METRVIGGSGVSISAIGLGGFELGPDPGDEPDVDRAANVIEVAIDSGVNWLDTSENYNATRNESLIGAALARLSDEFLVATKVAPTPAITGDASGFRREQVHTACRESLKRLGRDHIDMYFLHWPDDQGVPLEETWGAMAELADAGLVGAIGLSNYTLDDVTRCHQQRRVDVVEDGLSLIDYLDARTFMASCSELGISVVVFEPLASGILTDKTLDQIRSLWTGPWQDSGFYQRLLGPGRGECSAAVAEGLRPIAARLGATVAQVAIAWVLHQRGVTAAIVGSRDGRHVHENGRAADLDLRSVLEEVEALIPLGPTYVADRD